MQRWYVVYTHAQGEAKALRHLRRQGFHAYLPQYLKRRRHARRTDWVNAPLFPRYLFVNLDVEQARWRAINSTLGVISLVGEGAWPRPMPDGMVEEIQAREDEAGLIKLNPMDRFRKGDPVQVLEGALSDQVGLFDSMDDADRVVVLMELLGREVRVRLPAETVAAVV